MSKTIRAAKRTNTRAFAKRNALRNQKNLDKRSAIRESQNQ